MFLNKVINKITLFKNVIDNINRIITLKKKNEYKLNCNLRD